MRYRLLDKIRTSLKKEAFSPGIISLFFNPFYFARKGLFENINSLSKDIKGKVLDVGCGSKPYKQLFNNASKYIGMDIKQLGHDHTYEDIDIFYDGKSFPFKKNVFDSVVSFQVFEHVFNPDEFLEEISRVLKNKGFLLITVPFVWDEHEQPYDFARYSSFGLRYLLKKHNFYIIKHRKSMNDIRIIFQLINDYIYKKICGKFFYKNSYLRLIANLLFMSPFNILGSILVKILPKNNDLYLDNIILARKINYA